MSFFEHSERLAVEHETAFAFQTNQVHAAVCQRVAVDSVEIGGICEI